jgi:hypothetical protein
MAQQCSMMQLAARQVAQQTQQNLLAGLLMSKQHMLFRNLQHIGCTCAHATATAIDVLCCLLLQVVWAQMMSEQRSRLDACTKKTKDLYDYYRWALQSMACCICSAFGQAARL